MEKKIVQKSKRNSSKHETEKELSTIITQIPYLGKILEINETERNFICKLCTSNQPKIQGKVPKPIGGQIYWLKRHLETQRHQTYTSSQDKSILAESISLFDSIKKTDKPLSTPSKTAKDHLLKIKMNSLKKERIFHSVKTKKPNFILILLILSLLIIFHSTQLPSCLTFVEK